MIAQHVEPAQALVGAGDIRERQRLRHRPVEPDDVAGDRFDPREGPIRGFRCVVRELAELPQHRIAHDKPRRRNERDFARSGDDIAGERVFHDAAQVGRMIRQAAPAAEPGEGRAAEIMHRADVGDHQLRRIARDDLLGRRDQLHPVARRAERCPACADRRGIGEGRANRRAIVGHAVALGPAELDRDAPRLGQRAPVTPVARPRDEARVRGHRCRGGETVGDVAPRGEADRVAPAGMDQVSAAAQVLAGNLGEQEIGHLALRWVSRTR